MGKAFDMVTLAGGNLDGNRGNHKCWQNQVFLVQHLSERPHVFIVLSGSPTVNAFFFFFF